MFATVGDLDASRIAEAEGDAELAVYLSSMPGSINRALGDLETRRALPLCRRVIGYEEWEETGELLTLTLSPLDMICEAVRLFRESDGEELPLGLAGDTLNTRGVRHGERCVLLYRPRIRRVLPWENEGELEGVPDCVAALIPYFIKGELFREDDPNEAGEAINRYEGALETLLKNTEERSVAASTRVHTVYSQTGI